MCREHLAYQHRTGASLRALIVNAGNANAGTGQPGLKAARSTCAAVGELIGCAPEEVLPFSTGVIMEPLPFERIVSALPTAQAAARADGWFAAARAIMTTDTVPKGASRRTIVDGVPITVTGIAKGSGMIHPNMATMLSFMATDAPIAPDMLAAIVREVADESFNCVTVDGDTSTNDSFVIASTGQVPLAPLRSMADPRLRAIREAIEQVAVELAQAIVRDGEGATKFIEIRVVGGRSVDECRRVAFRRSPIRRWSRRPCSRPIRTSAASSARSATRQRPTSIPRRCRSGSTTCSSSSAADARRPIARRTASG